MLCRSCAWHGGPVAAVTRPVPRCLGVGPICAYPLASSLRWQSGRRGGHVAEHRDRGILWQRTRERFANEMAATKADGRRQRGAVDQGTATRWGKKIKKKKILTRESTSQKHKPISAGSPETRENQ